MKSYKKWVFLILSFIFICPILIALINYIVDPFKVFGTNFLPETFQENQRYLKVKFIDKAHNKYDSYLFGSSRISFTNPKIIEKYIKNSKFYNFTVTSANLEDNFLHIQYLFKKGYKVKNIYLEVDIDNNIKSSYKKSNNDLMIKLHPNVDNSNKIDFYIQYLKSIAINATIGKIMVNFKPDRENAFLSDINGTGMGYFKNKEQIINNNPELYYKNENTLNVNKVKRKQDYYIKNNINALKKIIKLCKTNKTNIIIFITPHNYNSLNKVNEEGYIEFLKEMSQITNYWDFSGYNSITTNNYNYYEESHYRPFIANIIAAKIFSDKTVKVPDDFGLFVTPHNILQHIEDIKAQIKQADIKWK